MRRNPDVVGLYQKIRGGYTKVLAAYAKRRECPAEARPLVAPLQPQDVRDLSFNRELLLLTMSELFRDGKITFHAAEYLAFVYCYERYLLALYREHNNPLWLLIANMSAWIRSCGQVQMPRGHLDGGGLSQVLFATAHEGQTLYHVKDLLMAFDDFANAPYPLMSLLNPLVLSTPAELVVEEANEGLRTWTAMWEWLCVQLEMNGLDVANVPLPPQIEARGGVSYVRNGLLGGYSMMSSFDGAGSVVNVLLRDPQRKRMGVYCTILQAKLMLPFVPSYVKAHATKAIALAESWIDGKVKERDVYDEMHRRPLKWEATEELLWKNGATRADKDAVSATFAAAEGIYTAYPPDGFSFAAAVFAHRNRTSEGYENRRLCLLLAEGMRTFTGQKR